MLERKLGGILTRERSFIFKEKKFKSLTGLDPAKTKHVYFAGMFSNWIWSIFEKIRFSWFKCVSVSDPRLELSGFNFDNIKHPFSFILIYFQGTMIINIGLSPSEGVMVIYPQIRSMSLCLNDGCTWYMARPNTHQSCQSKNRKWKWKQ